MIAPDLAQLARPVASLHEDPKNARHHDAKSIAAIAKSLSTFTQMKPIVALADGTVVAGNGTLRAAISLGWQEIAVVTFEDEEKARAFALADNQSALLSSWDADELRNALTEVSAQSVELLAATGFSDRDLALLLGPPPTLAGADECPDLPIEPVSRPGDVWQLGPHALACADARDAGAVGRLMGGARAACMWSDPPFGVRYVGGTKAALTIENDTAEGLPELLRGAFAVANDVLEPGAPFYIAHPTGPLALEFETAIRDVGWRHHETLVWVKDTLVLGHSDYHLRHEGLLYGWTAGPGRSGRGSHEGSRWYGDNAQTSVFEIPRPKRSEAHPTMKPVELVARCLANSTKTGDLVFEPFSGSGSTILACEQLGRVCRAVELDPRYTDVAVERWESVTGGKAQRRSA